MSTISAHSLGKSTYSIYSSLLPATASQQTTPKKVTQKLTTLGPKPKYLQKDAREIFSLHLPVSICMLIMYARQSGLYRELDRVTNNTVLCI